MSEPLVRQRLTRERRKQLIDVAWHIIRQEGTDALTLGYLATQAGVTKPVVYDHFDSRSGLFATLYREYDQRQTARMDEILRNTEPNAEAGLGDRQRLYRVRAASGARDAQRHGRAGRDARAGEDQTRVHRRLYRKMSGLFFAALRE